METINNNSKKTLNYLKNEELLNNIPINDETRFLCPWVIVEKNNLKEENEEMKILLKKKNVHKEKYILQNSELFL